MLPLDVDGIEIILLVGELLRRQPGVIAEHQQLGRAAMRLRAPGASGWARLGFASNMRIDKNLTQGQCG